MADNSSVVKLEQLEEASSIESKYEKIEIKHPQPKKAKDKATVRDVMNLTEKREKPKKKKREREVCCGFTNLIMVI